MLFTILIHQKINFAKQRSEVLDKLEGRWVPKKKLKKDGSNNVKKGQQEKQGDQQELGQQPIQMQVNSQKNELNQPNNVLILEELPSFITTDILKALFGQYPGFKQLINNQAEKLKQNLKLNREVRLISARKVAFVEFSQEEEATVALNGLQSFELTPLVFLKLNYAKF